MGSSRLSLLSAVAAAMIGRGSVDPGSTRLSIPTNKMFEVVGNELRVVAADGARNFSDCWC